MNRNLPESIRVVNAEVVSNEFHARMSAVGKEYAYMIWNDPDLPEEMADRVWHVPGALNFEAIRRDS